MSVQTGIDAGLHREVYHHRDHQISQAVWNVSPAMIDVLPITLRARDLMICRRDLAANVQDERFMIQENPRLVRT